MGLVSTWVSSTDVVGVKGWTGVKGVRDAKESCEVGCEMVSRRSGCRSRSSLNGVVLQGMSSVRRVLVRLWEGSCEGCILTRKKLVWRHKSKYEYYGK